MNRIFFLILFMVASLISCREDNYKGYRIEQEVRKDFRGRTELSTWIWLDREIIDYYYCPIGQVDSMTKINQWNKAKKLIDNLTIKPEQK